MISATQRIARYVHPILAQVPIFSAHSNRWFSQSAPAIKDPSEAELEINPRVRAQKRIKLVESTRPFAHPLIDSFNRKHTYLRISLTERCNLRCTYCMPEDGVTLTPKSDLLTTEEILRVATVFVDQGVTKIRLTGGEPTIRRDIVELVGKLNELKARGLEEIAITTNGIALKRKLPLLAKAGLDSVNISLDTLDPFQFQIITRRNGFENVMECIDLAVELGLKPKVNCVAMKRINEEEVVKFVEFTRDKNVFVRFIEYMPFDGNRWNADKFLPYTEMLQNIKLQYPDIAPLPTYASDTTKPYQVPFFKGKIGFITSMSNHFCTDCNRLRITADGNMKVCLFGSTEVSLRDMIRKGCSNDEILKAIGMGVQRKKARHAGMLELSRTSHENRPMVLIGG